MSDRNPCGADEQLVLPRRELIHPLDVVEQKSQENEVEKNAVSDCTGKMHYRISFVQSSIY